VELRGWADYVLAPALPGAPEGREVRAGGSARAVVLATP
jgi:hypothetical protein